MPEEPDLGQVWFESALRDHVGPEVARRRASGAMADSEPLRRFQVLYWVEPETPRVEIRLNEQVRAMMKVRATRDLQTGEPVRFSDFDDVAEIALIGDGDDANASHLTSIRTPDGSWRTGYRYQFNQARSREHLSLAEEYILTARLAADAGYLRPACENCLTAVELMVKAARLQFPGQVTKRNAHNALEVWFHRWTRAGHARSDTAALLKELNRLRRSVRFLEDSSFPTATFTEEAIAKAEAQLLEFGPVFQSRGPLPNDDPRAPTSPSSPPPSP